MALRELSLEGFRGVRAARVSFGRSTVLVGENGCGTASLLEALALARAPSPGLPRIERARFHREGDALVPLRIRLVFAESGPGSWDRPELAPLAAVLGPAARPRTLALEISAAPPRAGAAASDARWEVRSPGGRASRGDRAVLDAVRRINPLVTLRGAEVQGFARPAPPAAPGEPSPRRRAPRAAVAEILGRRISGREEPHAGARPLLVVEDPEAGLHPMTLASTWAHLERLPFQKVVATHSAPLLSAVPLRALRRLVRGEDGTVREFRLRDGALGKDDLRKVSYHLCARRGAALFARAWLLVEGETEFWILPDLARLQGHDLAEEGVACVEFAQCGLAPLLRLARALGIEWHVLADGDEAGAGYARTARGFLGGEAEERRISVLAERDIESTFWRHGFAPVLERLAGMRAHPRGPSPRRVIRQAIERGSKPGVAFELLAAAAAPGGPRPPRPLLGLLARCVALARAAGSGPVSDA